MMSAEAVAPAVAEAAQQFLAWVAGPAVLQTSLPALPDIVRDVTTGVYDERAWRKARDALEASQEEKVGITDAPGPQSSTDNGGAVADKDSSDAKRCVHAISALCPILTRLQAKASSVAWGLTPENEVQALGSLPDAVVRALAAGCPHEVKAFLVLLARFHGATMRGELAMKRRGALGRCGKPVACGCDRRRTVMRR